MVRVLRFLPLRQVNNLEDFTGFGIVVVPSPGQLGLERNRLSDHCGYHISLIANDERIRRARLRALCLMFKSLFGSMSFVRIWISYLHASAYPTPLSMRTL